MSGIRVRALSTQGDAVMRQIYVFSEAKDDRVTRLMRFFNERKLSDDPLTVTVEHNNRVAARVYPPRLMADLVDQKMKQMRAFKDVDYEVVII